MAYVTYSRTAVHATKQRPRFAWGRLFALAATIGLWVGIIAAVRTVL